MNPHLGRNPDAMLVRGPPGAAKRPLTWQECGRGRPRTVRGSPHCLYPVSMATENCTPSREDLRAASSARSARGMPLSVKTEHRPIHAGVAQEGPEQRFLSHSRRTSEHRPFHPRWRGLGRGRASYRPRLTWGCPPLDHRASLDRGDRHRGQGVDNPANGGATRGRRLRRQIVAGAQRSHASPKTSPDSKGESARPAPSKHRPFHAPRSGLARHEVLRRLDAVGRAVLPTEVERAMFCSVDTWGSVAVLQKYC